MGFEHSSMEKMGFLSEFEVIQWCFWIKYYKWDSSRIRCQHFDRAVCVCDANYSTSMILLLFHLYILDNRSRLQYKWHVAHFYWKFYNKSQLYVPNSMFGCRFDSIIKYHIFLIFIDLGALQSVSDPFFLFSTKGRQRENLI